MNLKTKILKQLTSTSFGDYFTIKELLVETPSGIQSRYYLREAEDFSIIIPFKNKDNCIMVRQYRLGPQSISLEFPMGIVHGKKALEMAKTELQEETGYTADTFDYIGSFYPTSSSSNQKASVYVAHGLSNGSQMLEPTEAIEVVTVPIQEISNMIKDAKIFDGPTIAAFGLYINLFGNNAVNMR